MALRFSVDGMHFENGAFKKRQLYYNYDCPDRDSTMSGDCCFAFGVVWKETFYALSV